MIGIDCTFIDMDEMKKGYLQKGVSIYLYDILLGLEELGHTRDIYLITYSECKKLLKSIFPNYPIISYRPILTKFIKIISKGNLKGNNISKRDGQFSHFVNKYNFDIVWFPFATPAGTAKLTCKSILTIHDLIMCNEKNQNRYKNMLMEADKIVAISNYVKEEIIKLTPDLKTNVSVVYNSISVGKEIAVIEELQGKKYILSINAFQERKNLITLLKAYTLIEKTLDYDLVLCGSSDTNGYMKYLMDYTEKSGLVEKVHFLYQVSNKEKNWLLKNASLFVTPSVNEGFGRTPIEAAECCVPVIVTNIDVLKEITMNKLYYYSPPFSENALANRIKEVLINTKEKEELDNIAEFFINKYSPKSNAKKYNEIFRSTRNQKSKKKYEKDNF